MSNTLPKILKIALTVLATAPLFAHAQAVLTVDSAIQVLAINNKSVSQGLFGLNAQKFDLPAGEHTFHARYEQLYEHGKDHDIVRSPTLELVATLGDEQTYHLSLPAPPKDSKSAKQYAKTVQLSLIDAQGNTLSQSHTAATQTAGFLGLGGLGNLFAQNEDTLEAFKALWSKASEEERNKIRSWLK